MLQQDWGALTPVMGTVFWRVSLSWWSPVKKIKNNKTSRCRKSAGGGLTVLRLLITAVRLNSFNLHGAVQPYTCTHTLFFVTVPTFHRRLSVPASPQELKLALAL